MNPIVYIDCLSNQKKQKQRKLKNTNSLSTTKLIRIAMFTIKFEYNR